MGQIKARSRSSRILSYKECVKRMKLINIDNVSISSLRRFESKLITALYDVKIINKGVFYDTERTLEEYIKLYKLNMETEFLNVLTSTDVKGLKIYDSYTGHNYNSAQGIINQMILNDKEFAPEKLEIFFYYDDRVRKVTEFLSYHRNLVNAISIKLKPNHIKDIFNELHSKMRKDKIYSKVGDALEFYWTHDIQETSEERLNIKYLPPSIATFSLMLLTIYRDTVRLNLQNQRMFYIRLTFLQDEILKESEFSEYKKKVNKVLYSLKKYNKRRVSGIVKDLFNTFNEVNLTTYFYTDYSGLKSKTRIMQRIIKDNFNEFINSNKKIRNMFSNDTDLLKAYIFLYISKYKFEGYVVNGKSINQRREQAKSRVLYRNLLTTSNLEETNPEHYKYIINDFDFLAKVFKYPEGVVEYFQLVEETLDRIILEDFERCIGQLNSKYKALIRKHS
ncbi:hypothetical protein RJG79_08585 [Mycoplasmatota bacterium WC44]